MGLKLLVTTRRWVHGQAEGLRGLRDVDTHEQVQDLRRRCVGARKEQIDQPLRSREPVQVPGTESIRQHRTREHLRGAARFIARGRRNLDLGVVAIRLAPPHPQAGTTQLPERIEAGDLPEERETS